MSIIALSHLSFSHDGGEMLFSDVSLQIDTRWKLGLVGRNGRGKTTLLKLLRGDFPYSGRIALPCPVDYFPYRVADAAKTTWEVIAENTADIAEMETWRLSRELSLLEVGEDVLDRPFETLSGGERTKVLLAALFLHDNHFLLIDEPTNHLDREGRRIVSEYLCGKSGFILVSHDRMLLDGCCDHILAINRTGLELVQGNFSTWRQSREYKARFETAENAKLRKEIGRLEDSARKSSDWSKNAEKGKYHNPPGFVDKGWIGTRAAKKMKLAKNYEKRTLKAAEEKTRLFKDVEVEDALSLSPLKFHGKRLVDVTDFSMRFGEKKVCEPLSFFIEADDRIALCGKNGCGKTSLLRHLAGTPATMNFTGSCRVPAALKISYLPQNTSFLHGHLRHFIEKRRLDESLYRALLHKLGFSGQEVETDMADYSEGQKKKFLLAASLCEPAHLYIWDEPLNFIDVISRLQIEKLLIESRATVIFVEHDEAFLKAVATKMIEM